MLGVKAGNVPPPSALTLVRALTGKEGVMTRLASVPFGCLLLALLAILGLDVYTARNPRLDEAALLSSLDRLTRIVPSVTRAKKQRAPHVRVCAVRGPLLAQAPPATFAAS
jgi:hypothetical protein